MTTIHGVRVPEAGHTTRFIAWAARPVTTPTPAGRSAAVRSQTAVTVYPPMSITRIEAGGRSGRQDDLARVVMDEASAGFSQPISASIRVKDNPAYQALADAHAAGRPVVLTTEVKRRRKVKGTDEEVPLTAPIQALRGADAPDVFAKASMDVSGRNVAVVIAAVDQTVSAECVSDPAEWAFLASNRYGDMAPAGWRFVGSVAVEDDAWRTTAALIPDEKAPSPAPGGEDLAALVRQAVTEALAAASGPTTTPHAPARGRDREPSTYAPRLGDGRVNLGWAGTVNVYWAWKWVCEQASEQGVDPTQVPDVIEEATAAVMRAADQVQADAYGHGFTPDRTARSHELARRLLADAATTCPLPVADLVNGQLQAGRQWAQRVIPQATRVLAALGRVSADFLQAPTQPTTPTQDEQAPEALAQVLQAAGRAWQDADALAEVWRAAEAAGVMDTPTETLPGQDGAVRLEARPGGTRLRDLIAARGRLLRSQTQSPSPQPPAQHTPAQDTPATPDAPAPEPAAPDQTVQDPDDGQGPVQEGLDLPGQQAEATGPMGYPLTLDGVATTLAAATTQADLHAAWSVAMSQGLTDAQVRFDGHAVQAADSAFAWATVSQVVTTLAATLPQDPPTQEQAEPQAPAMSAEEILAAAQAATTAAEISQLRDQAAKAGLSTHPVSMGGATGPLEAALKFLALQKG